MIRFIHTADVHFGMENYGKIDPVTGIHTRLLDFERAFTVCIDRAIQENVDFFVLSGDAYKTATPTPTHQRLLMRCLLRLYKAGIPVIIVVGNHDHPMSFGKTHALDLFSELPIDGFTVIAKPETITITTKNGPVALVGIPWPSRSTLHLQDQQTTKHAHELTELLSATIADIIAASAQKLDPNIPAVLAGHLTVSSGIFSGSEKRAIYGTDPIILPSQLALAPFDYVALGHLHRYQNLNPQGHPAIVYSGSIERIDFGERKEEKGFCLVSIHDKTKTTHEFIKVPTRPFLQIEVTLTGEQNHTEQILQAVGNYQLEEAVVKIVYHVPAHITDRVDTTRIIKACTHAHYLVGVIPHRIYQERERRALHHEPNHTWNDLLKQYLATKITDPQRISTLLAKAQQLAHEEDEKA